MIITMIIAITEMTIVFVETPELVVVTCVVVVAAAAVTVIIVCAVEGQYELVPAKVAVIVYMPVIGGVQLIAVVALCIGCGGANITVLLFGSTAVSVT